MNIKQFVILILSWFLLSSLLGCQLPGSQLEKSLAQAAEQLNQKISKEGVLQDWMVNADGHVQDPGLETYVTIKIAAGVHAVGVNGNIVARGKGDASRISGEFRDELLRELTEPNLPDARRTAIFEILGWNRH